MLLRPPFKMAFPLRAFVIASVTALLLFLFGFPVGPALFICFVTFLIAGGASYLRLFMKTFPRDLWMGSNLLKVLNTVKKHRKDHKILSDLFEEQVHKHPDKPAIIFTNEDRTWTYCELNEYANRVANYFSGLGLQKGDSAALFMENSPEYIGLYLGLWKIGVVVAFLNHNLRHESLTHCIRAAKSRALIFSSQLAGAVSDVWSELEESSMDASRMCFAVCGDPEGGERPLKRLDRELQGVSASPPPALANKSFEDKACFIYTSGTTGLPKACVVKHSKFFHMQMGVHVFAQITPNDIVYNSLPLYHTSGGVLAVGQMLFWGSTFVLRKKFSASNFFTDCVKYKCTVVFHIGELCRYLLAQPSRPTDAQHCVRMAIGNGLRLQIWKQFQKRFSIKRIVEFYGSTEGNVNVINVKGKPGACGAISVILPFLNPLQLIKVDETGKHVRNANGYCVRAGVDEPGEAVGSIDIRISTKHFDGYEDKNATSKKILKNVFKAGDQYFLSGDILRMDEEGYVYFCDRTGDTFRWKGENVSTMEIEGVIQSILEHRDAAVYGVEVPGMEGRAGMAAIVGTARTVPLTTLYQQLSLSLPAYAVPLFVRFITVADTTGTHKLKKVGLRNEGCNPDNISDPVFFLHPQQKAYVPFTRQIYEDIVNGTIRL